MSNSRSYQPALIADVVTNPTPGQVALTTLASDVLPDGCEAFVISNRTLYRLNKSSTDAPLGNATAGIVAAAGPGNWIPQSASQGLLGVQNLIDLLVGLAPSPTFNPLTAGPNGFASIHSGDEWSINTTTGVCLWNGPAQRFLANVSASIYNNTTLIDTILGISVNGQSAVPTSRQIKTTSPVATGSAALYHLSLATIVLLNQGETVEVKAAGEASTATITNLILTLTPLLG